MSSLYSYRKEKVLVKGIQRMGIQECLNSQSFFFSIVSLDLGGLGKTENI